MSKEDDTFEEPTPSESGCVHCGGETPQFHNYCSSECVLDAAKAAGGKTITPNNLPITCIKYDGTMLEHAHADHPTYVMPVDVEFIGEKPSDLPDWDSSYETETHALIFADDCVALTLYECTYSLWSLNRDGAHLHSSFGMHDKNWRLSEESVKKTLEFFNKKHSNEDEVGSEQ